MHISDTRKEALFCSEKGGLELLGFVVHSLIHYVAFEKALSHSAVLIFLSVQQGTVHQHKPFHDFCTHCYHSELLRSRR